MSKFGSGDKDTRLVRNDPTRLIRKPRPDAVTAGSDNPTLKIDPKLNTPPVPPVKEETPAKAAPEFMNLDPGKTKVFRAKETESSEVESGANETPVVGWLVIVQGAGQGSAIEFSYGQQSIGRDLSQSIQLDFGDEEISRERHAVIEYDPRERKVYLSKGANLVYHNGERVGQGAETVLSSGDTIELGKTVLRFIAFCGPDFCWTQV